MSTDKYAKMGQEIYDHIGGMSNVESLYHCMTRIRIAIRDEDKVDVAGLKAVNGVLGVVEG
ncbi:permease, partial [Lactobacillus sp. XV13L]|nr:permease [Lactobacillus sp. XV13L]